MRLRPLEPLPTAIRRGEDAGIMETASGSVIVLPHEMRAAQASRVLTRFSLLDVGGGGGPVNGFDPHAGSIREFNEYQRAAEHAGDPVSIRLRRNLGNLKGLVAKIECDTDEWPEAPFKSLVIKEGKDKKITLIKKGTEASPAYESCRTVIDGRDVDDLSRHADTFVAVGFLFERALGMIYDSKMVALSPQQEPAPAPVEPS